MNLYNFDFLRVGARLPRHNLEAIRAALDTWAAELRPGQLQVIGMENPKSLEAFGVRFHKSDCPDSHRGGACKDLIYMLNVMLAVAIHRSKIDFYL